MSWLKYLHVPTSRRHRRAEAKRRPVGKRVRIETLEHRLLLAADTPFTVDGQPWAVAARGASVIEAENYDYGGEGVAYHSSYASNPGGAYRPDEGVGVEGPSAAAGGTYNVGYFGSGNWLNYSINVAQAGTYVVDLRAATATSGATARVTFGAGGASTTAPAAATGNLALPGTGGWGNYQDLTATVALPAGRQIMTVWNVASGYNLDAIKLTPLVDSTNGRAAVHPNRDRPRRVAPWHADGPPRLRRHPRSSRRITTSAGRQAAPSGVQSCRLLLAECESGSGNVPLHLRSIPTG